MALNSEAAAHLPSDELTRMIVAERALRVTAFDYCIDLTWRPSDDRPGEVDLYILCGNAFGGDDDTDGERVTAQNIDLLERTFAEGEAVCGKYGATWASVLFCARVRGQVPTPEFMAIACRAQSTQNDFWREAFQACTEPADTEASFEAVEADRASWGETARRIMSVTTLNGDADSMWWRPREGDEGVIDFYVTCSDVFAWGCADVEGITEETIDLFEQTHVECREKFDAPAAWPSQLYCARIRKMRPQGAWYNQCIGEDSQQDDLWRQAFDACGPARALGFDNPQAVKRVAPLALLVTVETVSDEDLPSDSDGDEWGEDEIDGETVWSRTVYTCPHCGLKITDDGSDTLMDPTGDMDDDWPVLRGPHTPGKTYIWKHLPCGQMVTWTPIAAQIELGQK